jgi:hypothetical protein
MIHLVVLAEYTYAGYCSTGGNKDWAACVAVETDDQNTSPPILDKTTEVVYLSLHGPHGGNMVIDSPKKLALNQAIAHFTKKCREKDGKLYKRVPFASYLPAFGHPFGLSLVVSGEGGQIDGAGVPSTHALEDETSPVLAYQAVIVKDAPLKKIQQILTGDNYGLEEKVNGERCLLVFDGEKLVAFNRRGKPMSAPPAGASHLCRLGCPFVVDGERLTGELAGHFVAFDLLELNHEAYIDFSYTLRITALKEAMRKADLLVSLDSTPTLASARANSTVDDLSLLVSVAGSEIAPRILADIQASSGEGIIVRRLEASYTESPFKWKFITDLDAFVIGINSGLAEGSLKFGVVRSEDGAVIEVANVRSGFTDQDIRTVRKMVERGERPVFTIIYLPIRTVGVQLVEPRSGMRFLRTDKSAAQCTTEQFGPEKAPFIAQAKPIEGVALL